MYSAVKYSLTPLYIWRQLTPPRHLATIHYLNISTQHIALIFVDAQAFRSLQIYSS